jgi:hypothetical protein
VTSGTDRFTPLDTDKLLEPFELHVQLIITVLPTTYRFEKTYMTLHFNRPTGNVFLFVSACAEARMEYLVSFLSACVEARMEYLVSFLSACAKAYMKYLVSFLNACAEVHTKYLV